MMRYLALIALCAYLPSAQAQTPTCDRLTGKAKARAEALLESERSYANCTEPIARCLKQSALARRLAEDICRRIAAGQESGKISTWLRKRKGAMAKGAPVAEIDLKDEAVAGDPKAPVTLVVYACARCPYCGLLLPQVYNAVTKGALKGRAKLYFKLFPLRGHAFSKESGLAYTAAAISGRYWEYVLYAYARFDQYAPEKDPAWATAVGIDQKKFVELLKARKTRVRLVNSKKEGLRHKVDATPTFFINGRKIDAGMTLPSLIDLVEEELERPGE